MRESNPHIVHLDQILVQWWLISRTISILLLMMIVLVLLRAVLVVKSG
jgi:hypothetical protein